MRMPSRSRRAATRSARSHAKPTLDLVVRDAFTAIEFFESSLDFGEEYQALDGIVNGRVRRKFPQSLYHSVARICGSHVDFDCSADQFLPRLSDSVGVFALSAQRAKRAARLGVMIASTTGRGGSI